MAHLYLPLRKPIYEHYLRNEFNIKNGAIEVSRKNDVGKYLYSRIRYSDYPVNKSSAWNQVLLRFKGNHNDQLDTKCIYYSAEDIVQINDYIHAAFSLFFHTYMEMGKEMGIRQNDLLESFISGNRFTEAESEWDMIKKKDYRYRVRMHKFIMRALKKTNF